MRKYLLFLMLVIGLFLGLLTSIFLHLSLISDVNRLTSKTKDLKDYALVLEKQQKWFTEGYIEIYNPGRYLFNGSPAGNSPIIAHPFLPIGTFLMIHNLDNDSAMVAPVLDRKYIMADRVILSITKETAIQLGWHPYNRFKITIIGVPPAYTNKWYTQRETEKRNMKTAVEIGRK